MTINSTTKLNNGIEIPYLGLGVWRMEEGKETIDAVTHALKVGYRHIDTAQFYGNETSVGDAVKQSNVSRDEIFVTSKLAISNFGREKTLKSFEETLNKLGFKYIDLFLLHFPVNDLSVESWRALEEIYQSGKAMAIGVSNFTIEQLKELMTQSDIVPAINQVEFSPYLYQEELLEYCWEHNIQLQAYSPLTKGNKLNDPELVKIAETYNKTPAQILIRWHLQHNIVVIPKSSNPQRIEENAAVFDFEITKADMQTLNKFNQNLRFSWNPEDPEQVAEYSSYATK